MTEPTYRGVEGDEELAELARVLNEGFGLSGDEELRRDWIADQPQEELRQVRARRTRGAGDEMVATLTRIPMGHYLGGRPVTSVGIAAVAVPALRRGEGHARRLMRAALEEAHEEGFALSTLYASTYRLYRSVGFERAGTAAVLQVTPERLQGIEPLEDADDTRVLELTPDDEADARALYESYAPRHDGYAVRSSEGLWWRATFPRRIRSEGALVLEGDRPTGYARWIRTKGPGYRYELHVSDMAATTAAAARRIVSVLRDHGTIGETTHWGTGPGDPLAALLPGPRFDVVGRDDWMVRVVDVTAALEQRGYASDVAARLEFAVDDPDFDANAGQFTLDVEDGRGTVRRGGSGTLRVTARALAPLVTGFATARQLALTGGVEGNETSLATAGALFASSGPWMVDRF
ncbi:MAG: GNAT family N-acetyltransferase [Planctomycetota bacterium]